MYVSELWFDKKRFGNSIVLPPNEISNWIELKDIEAVGISYWAEHCLECAVPVCYYNCENWSERMDKKCRKTHYGMKRYRLDNYIQAAQFRFKRWGKLETPLCNRLLKVKAYKRVAATNAGLERVARKLSDILLWFSPTRKPAGAYVYFVNKYMERLVENVFVDTFLIQCYSPAKKIYRLIFEIYNGDGIFYRNSMLVNPGFNQALYQVPNFNWEKYKNSRMRLYPEYNVEEELILFCSDFIRLKKECQKNNSFLNKTFVSDKPSEKVKCVVWDLDCTIWDGILTEKQQDELVLREGVLNTIKTLDERGIVQAVASKNEQKLAEEQLCRLGIAEYFVCMKIDWNAKSQNIQDMADWLNININSFAFIDDSPYERGEVSENKPMVRVYDGQNPEIILTFPEFDVPVTEDGKNRRMMYRTEWERRRIRSCFKGTDTEFLKSCGLEAKIEFLTKENLQRSYELVQRTNQLNLSGRKYELNEFASEYLNEKVSAFVVYCKDRFGDYGQVGFFVISYESGTVFIVEYAMSCRVALKWLEPAIVQWLQERYNAAAVVFHGKNNKKNGLLVETLKNMGFSDNSKNENELELYIKKGNMDWMKIVKVISEI